MRWEPSRERFDHARTGYPLAGKHAGLECARCHRPAHIPEGEKRTLAQKDLSRSYLGLSRDCTTCHRDPHKGQLGNECARCHSFADWNASATFDHSKTRYPLTGRHIQVACQKCHAPTGSPELPVKFTGIAFGRCADCHADPHRGAFAGTCESCHTTAAWKRVSLEGKFDHAKTDFPLVGKHVQVACTACHSRGDFKAPLAHQRCDNCHKPDPHGGQFRARADGGDCGACHTVEGFQPARFGVTEHAQTEYPLEGRHGSVACEKCHLPAGRATKYKIPFTRCTDCHTDAHAGQFAAVPHQNRCENCHTVQGFQPATFTPARHQESRFPLTGGHLAVACVDCHRPPVPARPGAVVRYHFDDLSCTACHEDPHRGQFRDRMAQLTRGGAAAGCEACHSTKSWRELSRFDHGSTRFALIGAHRGVACMDCHRPPALETTMKNVVFGSAPRECEECHEDVHAGQFAKAGKSPGCAECHNSTRWRPSLFDHDTRTNFPLEGGHANVPCSACHGLYREVAGKRVLFYQPTPTECAACHGA